MAAPSSKQSPSNQKMHESGANMDENRLKDPPPSSLPAAPAAAVAASAMPPSYKKSESCESYVLAKQLLNNDNFEEALTVIEDQLIKTTAEIRANLGLDPAFASQNAELETEIELHEALAPLHYLYGTTLLYSLEEAKEDGNDTGAMMTAAGAQAATTATPAAASAAATADPTNPWAHLSAPATAEAAQPEPQPAAATDAAHAEDIQIAWENLEAARTIVEKMLLLATTGTTSTLSETEVAKLQLDLAQIHLREGDLQRINGNYTSAVGDYSSCLEILLRHNGSPDEAGNPRDLHRKIADTQFNLGLTYLTSSSDLQKEVASANATANANANEASSSTTTDQREKAALLAREHCHKGIQQHVDCAKTFCGIVARDCGVDPHIIWDLTDDDDKKKKSDDDDGDGADKKPAAGFKTTGLDDEFALMGKFRESGAESDRIAVVSHFMAGNIASSLQSANLTRVQAPASNTAAHASQTLNIWRKAVSTMVISSCLRDEDNPTPEQQRVHQRVMDICQVLVEIQETIDEAERSQEGVLQAAEIRVKAQQAAAASDGEVVANPDGSTTTIGFGAASVSNTAAAVEDKKPAAVPMMVVKKKKKRKDPTETEESNADTKPAPEESEANKRAKTE